MPHTVYLAAALFAGRETSWNAALAAGLEAARHRVHLPQRDGFEFAELQQHLPTDSQVDQAKLIRSLIYHLDLGVFLAASTAVVAVLDEPLDEGVIVELCYARMAGIPVFGLRTDARSPFGSHNDGCGGMHFFPWLQCDAWSHLPASSTVDEAITASTAWLAATKPATANTAPWQDLVNRATQLFPTGHVDDLPTTVTRACHLLASLPEPVAFG